jgi:hypothetical protein
MTTRQDGPMHPGDGFGLTADPSAYVPRLALETALTQLQEAVARPPACAALIGEPGLGKTLLLRVLAERVEGAFESLYVPFPRLAPHELWAWLAAALGVAGSGDDRVAVLAHAQRSRDDGLGLLLLVDDGGALPPETRTELIGTCRAPGLALVMAFSTDDRALLAQLPTDVRRVELGPPMTLPELRSYVRARLRRVDPSGIISARLGAHRMAELHEASGGVPARVHVLLDAWLRGRRVESLPPGIARPAPRPAAPPAAAPSPPPVAPTASPPPAASAAQPVVPIAAAPLPRDDAEEDEPTETPASGFRVERGPRRRPPRPDDGDERQTFFRRSRRRGGVRVLPAVLLVLLLAGVWYATSEPGRALLFERERGESAPPPDVAAAPPGEPPAFEPAPPADFEFEPLAAEPSPPAEAEPAPPLEPPRAPEAEPTLEPPIAAAPEPQAPPDEAPPAREPEPLPEPEPAPDVAAAPPPAPSREPELPAPPAPPPAAATEPEPAPTVLALPVRPPPPGARLSVNAEPWAEIRLDGRSLGQTPLGEVPLSPGRHRVSATMPDGSVVERTVEARSGDVYVTFP